MHKNKHKLLMILLTFLFLFTMPLIASAEIKIEQPATSMFIGEKMQLAVSGTTSRVRWSSSDKSIATVKKGKVTAKKKGTVTITAKVRKKVYTCKIKVKQPVTSMTLSKTSYFLMPGKTVTLTATCLPSTASLKTVSWKSSNKNILTVSKGVVKAVKNGTATVTATAKDGSGVKATCKIIVLQSSDPVKPDPVKPDPVKPDPVETTPGTTANGTKFLKILEQYNQIVMTDVAAGRKWKYRNTSQSRTFAEALSSNNRVVDCAKMVTWGLLDMKILSGKERIYGDITSSGGIINYGNDKNSPNYCEAKIKKACTVTKVDDTVQNLVKKGKIVPGDIITYKTIRHTNVYAGKTKDGKYKFYDSGKGSDNGTWINGVYHQACFTHVGSTAPMVAAWVIHIK